jgi:hypothetical protein
MKNGICYLYSISITVTFDNDKLIMIVPKILLLDKSIDSKPPYCCTDDGILPCNILPAKFNTFN